MPTCTLTLTDRDDAMISELIASGRYADATDVLTEGLRLIVAQETSGEDRLAALRAAIREGEAAIEAGEYVDFSSFEALSTYLMEQTEDIIAGENDAKPTMTNM